jgi:hypothetical protein
MEPKREHYNALPLAPGKGERAKYKEVKPATFGRQDVRVRNRISYHHSPPPVKKQHWSISLTGGTFFIWLIIWAVSLVAEAIR